MVCTAAFVLRGRWIRFMGMHGDSGGRDRRGFRCFLGLQGYGGGFAVPGNFLRVWRVRQLELQEGLGNEGRRAC